MKKKVFRKIFISFIVVFIFGFFIVYQQEFSVIDLKSSKLLELHTDGASSKTFSFDDYEFKVDTLTETRTFSGCDDTDNWNNWCSMRYERTGDYGCKIMSASTYKCLPGYYDGNLYLCEKRGVAYCDTSSRRYTSGARFYGRNYGCFWRGDIYYNGNLVHEWEGILYKATSSSSSVSYKKGLDSIYLTSDGEVVSKDEEWFYSLSFGSSISEGSGDDIICKDISGDVNFNIQESDFMFNLTADKKVVGVGENVSLDVELEQTVRDFSGVLKIEFVSEGIFGSQSKITTRDVNVSKGINTFENVASFDSSSENIKIITSIDLNYEGNLIAIVSDSFNLTVLSEDENRIIELEKEIDELEQVNDDLKKQEIIEENEQSEQEFLTKKEDLLISESEVEGILNGVSVDYESARTFFVGYEEGVITKDYVKEELNIDEETFNKIYKFYYPDKELNGLGYYFIGGLLIMGTMLFVYYYIKRGGRK